MSTEKEPCNSNDYQLSLYSSLLDDDEYTMNILPCANATVEDGVGSGVVVSGEDGDVGVISSGGGGESSVEATVASRTTPAATVDEGVVTWETTEAPTTSEFVITEQTTTPTQPLFSTTEPEADEDALNEQTGGGGDKPEEASASVADQEEDEAPQETVHEETTKESTFYTCHANPESLLSGELAPDDTSATKYELVYDYEIITSSDGSVGDTLAQLENGMTQDLAEQYGLVDCSARLRRALKKSKRSAGGLVALDSDPVDKVREGESCRTAVEENTICTPVRGYMTVWSESDETSAVLQYIESSMNNGSYQSGNIQKVVYIGAPTSTEVSQSDVNGASRSQEMESVEQQPGISVFLPVGISIVVVAIACIAFFIVRRRKNDVWDERNGPRPDGKTEPHSKLEAPPTIDLEDDINLLPSQEKMDMRPINTDIDTESAEMSDEENSPMKPIHDEDLLSVESSVFSQERDESVESGSAASGLAAMGAASTLAAKLGSDSIA